MNIITNKWAYYNDVDPKACAWARQLIKAGLVASGEVDERSITEVEPSDLKGFVQHHFFSGILGWSRALRIAGWEDDRCVCTASLPCQPFSVTGQQKGKADERHLLPHFIELVKQCNFRTIFGEQVPGAIKHGWLDDLCFEMERENYAVGSLVLTAACAGAPHIRQRLYWVANSNSFGLNSRSKESEQKARFSAWINIRSANNERVADSNSTGSQELFRKLDELQGFTEDSLLNSRARAQGRIVPTNDEWSGSEWIYCRDNKYRPIKPGIKPLVDGIPKGMVRGGDSSTSIDADNTQEARVMRLKGYGNAIVPHVAAQFIRAFMEIDNYE